MTSSEMDFIRTVLIGERRTEECARGQARPAEGEIARLAYHLYEARGRGDGHDLDDWVLAERELTRGANEDTTESTEADEISALSALRNGSTLRS